MFTYAIVAIDDSKFKAVNSKENNYTPKKLQFHIDRVEKHIEDYLQQLDIADKAENPVTDGMLFSSFEVRHALKTISSAKVPCNLKQFTKSLALTGFLTNT